MTFSYLLYTKFTRTKISILLKLANIFYKNLDQTMISYYGFCMSCCCIDDFYRDSFYTWHVIWILARSLLIHFAISFKNINFAF